MQAARYVPSSLRARDSVRAERGGRVQGPQAEAQRLEALRRYAILDSDVEPSFERLCGLTARLLAAPMAAISFIDEHRQWFKSTVGIPMKETPRHQSFCQYTIL